MKRQTQLKSLLSPRTWFDTRHSLQRALFWAFAAVIFLPMLLVGGIVTYSGVNSVRQNAQEKLVAVARLKENATDRWLDDLTKRFSEKAIQDIALQSLYELERRPNATDHTISRFRLDILSLVGKTGDFKSMTLLDNDGIVVASTDDTLIGNDFSRQHFYIVGLETPHFSALRFDEAQNRSTLYLALPLANQAGERQGLLVSEINVEALTKILGEIDELGPESETYLAVQSGRVLAPDLSLRADDMYGVGINSFKERNDIRFYENYADVPVISAERFVDRIGAALLVEQSQDAAFKPILQTANLLLIVTLVIVAVSVVLGYALSRRIISPVQALTNAASEITEGNFSRQIEVYREDEVGALAASFRTMTQRLKELIDSLEARVEERTKALTHQGVQLRTAIEVSQTTSTELDPQKLIEKAVEKIKSEFNYYYVGLFLVGENYQWAVLKAGTGEAGKRQIANNHRLKIEDSSMIGWSIVHRKARISGEAKSDEVRFKNPYLPDTQAEMALPLISRDQVLGALTLQSTRKDAFSPDDINVLQSVADQLANALQNGQLFNQAQILQSKFQDLYHRAPTAYHTQSIDGTIREINDTGLRLLGYDGQREQIINVKNISEFLTEESKRYLDEIVEELRIGKRDRAENIELNYRKKDGALLPVLLTIAIAETQGQGSSREIYVSAQDISQQKEIEKTRENLFQETEILYDLGLKLLDAKTETEIYNASLTAMQTINPTWGIAVLAYDRRQNIASMKISALWAHPEAPTPPIEIGSVFQVGESGLQNVVGSGTVVKSKDAPHDPQFNTNSKNLFTHLGVTAMAGIPIQSGEATSGFVLIANREKQAFSDEQIRLVTGVTRQMAIALNNFRNLRRATQQAAQLQAAAEVAKSSTTHTDLAGLLSTTTELIQSRFNYYAVCVFLVDDYRQYGIIESIAVGHSDAEADALRGFKLPLNSKSQVATAIVQATIQNIPDTAESELFQANSVLQKTQSELSVPLMVQNTVIGVLDIQSERKNDFQSDEPLVFKTIADQLANAIHVARLLEQERSNANEIQLLHRRYLEDAWMSFLQSDTSSSNEVVILPDEEPLPNEWYLSATDELTTQSIVVPSNGTPERTLSVLLSPLSLRGAPLGTMALVDDKSREWTEDERAIVEAVSTQASLAIDNARLIEQTERWVAQLRTSAEISQSVTASLDLDELLAHSVSLIRARFMFKQVSLYLTNAESENWDAWVHRSDRDFPASPTAESITLRFDGLAWRAIHQQQSVVVQASKPGSLTLLPANVSDNIQSAFAIPLFIGKESMGALEIFCTRHNAFDENLVAVLEILATQIATSIGNARAYQEEREITDKLREVDRLKTQFLANMSHELRTPLNSIIGFSRVILKGIDGPLTEMQRTDLSSIHQSGRHLLDLINNILDLAKIEAGKMEISLSAVNLTDMLNGIVSTATGLVKDKNVVVEAQIPDDLPQVLADETRLRQVLLNLVSNAAKFTDEGHISISVDADVDHVRIHVKDTGIGISAENLDSIFNEFTQVDASTTRKAGGTGLGLPITKQFIEMQNGEIAVESELGKGSTFTITLPCLPPESNPDADSPDGGKLAAPKMPEKILVIDGDPRIAGYYKQYLDGKNIEITNISIGENALEVTTNLQPSVILLDVLLPDISGWQVLQELSNNPRTAHIPVIVCSIIQDRFRATRLGAVDYLVKPIIKSDLISALERLEHIENPVKHVLVVDDHADDILLIRRILESRAALVLEAKNGIDALDIISEKKPDLVILDLTMPELDGFAVLEKLAADPKTAEMPIIVITARTLTVQERAIVTQHADALLNKGNFTDAELLQHVDTLLNKQ